MSSDPKKYSAPALYGTLAVGVACGALICYFLKPDPCKDCCAPVKPGPIAMTAFFDGTSLDAIMKATDSWGGRFYLCKGDDGSLSVLSGPLHEDGSHSPDASGTLQFMVFKGISGDATEVTLLDEPRAEASVEAASTPDMPTWAIDVSNEVLESVLRVTDANGIGLQHRATTSKDWSFEVAPVKISGGAAYRVGADKDVLLGAYPCPMNCPKDPALYLHMR